ncbi:MAG: isochorismatase family cysteine hydrolase [Veillonella caviae]|uniref:cysteine hydrolase family protein n=1 Tax=Veillonella caviae TaxID=248316 RepID=UPI002A9153D2|nr:isochorismatase family cysteine hydrolase [Veillonella caviae]MDY5480980.1 isochorismatase family cysteine hydrolase [Veillonella caviae]
MQHILLVIDMQYDFIWGSLGTSEAQAVVPYVADVIQNWKGPIVFTQDTHDAQYLDTQEGRILPVVHCVKGTDGWQIPTVLVEAAHQNSHTQKNENNYVQMIAIEKPCFGSLDLVHQLQELHRQQPIENITMVGLCTDICVVSNALLVKAGLPEVPLYIDAAGCAGVTPEKHKAALETMSSCQCHVIND